MDQDEFTVIVLSNGLKVANFSSPHPFTFTDGSVLPACSPERAKEMMLESREVEAKGVKGTIDIELRFEMSEKVRRELLFMASQDDIDLILVPLPVLSAWKEYCIRYDDYMPEHAHKVFAKARTCRVADRVTKVIHHDRFCK